VWIDPATAQAVPAYAEQKAVAVVEIVRMAERIVAAHAVARPARTAIKVLEMPEVSESVENPTRGIHRLISFSWGIGTYYAAPAFAQFEGIPKMQPRLPAGAVQILSSSSATQMVTQLQDRDPIRLDKNSATERQTATGRAYSNRGTSVPPPF
jgi:hypothetical protein